MTSDGLFGDDLIFGDYDDHPVDRKWRKRFPSVPEAVSGKYPYFMVRCSLLMRRESALVARKYGFSREEWVRTLIADRISDETGYGVDELLAGGPLTRAPNKRF